MSTTIRTKAVLAVATGLVAAAALGGSVKAAPSQKPSREPQFCSIYLDTLCFSLPIGQTLNVSLPVDFLLYTMPLSDHGMVTIYSGFHPEDPLEEKATQKCAIGKKVDRCEFADDGKVFDLIYDTGGMSHITHIHIDGLSELNRDAAKSLLDGFHACTSHGISMACSADKPFRDVMRPAKPGKP